jgi:hypothetical protein
METTIIPAEENNNIIHKLVDIKILIDTKRNSFTPVEQKKIYDLYNEITGENKQPNGCGACLNNTITRLKKECRIYGI